MSCTRRGENDRAHPTKDTSTELILRLLSFWRILFGVLALAGAAASWAGLQTLVSNWQRILLSVTLLLFAVLSVAGAFQIRRRDHSGRIISLALDYLAFVACTVITLNTGAFFIGIDALGTNFGRSIPYLGIVLAGYLLSTLDDYFPQRKQTSESSLKLVGRWVAIAGFILFLWQVNAVSGILYFLGKLVQPSGLIAGIASKGKDSRVVVMIWGMVRREVPDPRKKMSEDTPKQ